MQHARRVILELHADAVGFLDHVPVGDDVSLAVDDYTRAQRLLTNSTGIRPTLAAEETIKEILERILVVSASIRHMGIIGTRPSPSPPVGMHDGRFGVDVS